MYLAAATAKSVDLVRWTCQIPTYGQVAGMESWISFISSHSVLTSHIAAIIEVTMDHLA